MKIRENEMYLLSVNI